MRLPDGHFIDFDPTDPLAGFTETRTEHPLPEPVRSYARSLAHGETPDVYPGTPEWDAVQAELVPLLAEWQDRARYILRNHLLVLREGIAELTRKGKPVRAILTDEVAEIELLLAAALPIVDVIADEEVPF